MTHNVQRTFPRPVKRVVVKVGSSVISTFAMKARTTQLKSLVTQLSKIQNEGVEVILVSSGAIVLGMGEMNLAARPTDLASLQALAAIGQAVLMKTYYTLFKQARAQCAQVLLTWDDFDARHRYLAARHTLEAIMSRKVIAVINENDTISTEEIKFGDNDKLSALVAGLVHADLLVLLSDVEGLYENPAGEKKIYEEIKEITREIEGAATGTIKKNISRGGMTAKLSAIKIATHANVPCIIANGQTKDVLLRILRGERIGTFFYGQEDKSLARQHWLSFSAKPKGSIVVDDGARDALLKGGKSLLLPGVVSWSGHFKADDVVVVCDRNLQEIGRGVTNYSIADLQAAQDKQGKREVIHCDNLVLSKK